jgi:uncharacterized protein with NAD-binding domain and iron-sulfur cluster
MYQQIRTVPTQALQVWLGAPPSTFGCPVANGFAISFERPFNSWADMSQVLANEAWPKGTVESLAYFCDSFYPKTTNPQNEVAANAADFLASSVRGLWPGFVNGPTVVKRTYPRVNVDPSDRYVLSEQDCIKHRLDPDQSEFTNLALAGDWVRTPLNAGCLEGATLGGLAAAHGIINGVVRG